MEALRYTFALSALCALTGAGGRLAAEMIALHAFRIQAFESITRKLHHRPLKAKESLSFSKREHSLELKLEGGLLEKH